MTTCDHCGQPFTPSRSDARFCSPAHRKRAKRRRDALLAEDTYPDGAGRGRVPLAQATDLERVSPLLRVVPVRAPKPTDPVRAQLQTNARRLRVEQRRALHQRRLIAVSSPR